MHETLAGRTPKPTSTARTCSLTTSPPTRRLSRRADGPAPLFEAEGQADAVITWHELAWHGVTIAGPPI